MPKLNKFLVFLMGLGVALMAIIGIYEIFLKPPEELPSDTIQPINTYYGEDVLEFIKTK